MQFNKITSTSKKKFSLMTFAKVILVLAIIYLLVSMINKIDFPSPNKTIEKIIPNEKIRIVK
jgi:hypothetical protein|tara:strand:- start:2142 stop:2327 length:186 start_codon:yes stop_codon:yes gene_type:complete